MRKIYILFTLVILFIMTGCTKEIKLNISEKEIILHINEEYVINYEVDNAPNDTEVVIETAGDNIKIDENTITALKIGAEIVTLYLKENPSIRAEIVVIVEDSFAITSEIDSLYISETRQIQIKNNTDFPLNLNWFTSNEDVATIKDGLITAKKAGITTISIINSNTNERKAFDVNILADDPEEVIIEGVDPIHINYEKHLTAKTLPKTASQEFTWESSDTNIATVDENGVLRAIRSGEANITATSKADPSLSATITIEFYVDPIKLLASFNEEKPIKQYVTTFGYNPSERYQWVYGSVSSYFNDDMNLVTKIVPIDENEYAGKTATPEMLEHAESLLLVRSGILHEETKYITYHDTGNHTPGANAKMHADYMVGKDNRGNRARSWHYTVDENYIYHHIPDNEVAWQGDSYDAYAKSIGIETCVDFGSDLYTTWHRTAKLIASLLVKHNLTIDAIKQHYDFSRKNCPQTLRMSNLYDKAIELVETEYIVLTELKDYNITFTSLNKEFVDDHGRVIDLPKMETKVGYKVHITNNNGYDEEIILYSTLPAKE